jgi:hypothetical protein
MTSLFSEAPAVPTLKSAIAHTMMILVILPSHHEMAALGPHLICDAARVIVN